MTPTAPSPRPLKGLKLVALRGEIAGVALRSGAKCW